MKNIFYFIGSLCVAIAAAFLIQQWLSDYENPGYVLIGFGHWSLETSVLVFAVGQIIVFFVMYLFFRLIGVLLRLPSKMQSKGKSIKFNRSQEALITGLVDSAEGNWEKAEKILIKHASNSGAPLLHYLTAAKAAQSRGAIEKRDEYLRVATEKAGDSDLAVGLTQAELHLSSNQFDQALDKLIRLQSIDPSHASVLKMLHQVYERVGDWEALHKLIPSLHQNKILMEAEVKLLETETLCHLLREAAETGNAEKIDAMWQSIPEHVQAMQGMANIYFAAMIEAGKGVKIEGAIVKTMLNSWNETLLVLYGNIKTEDHKNQLQTAEQWLSVHSGSAVLLRVLGKISIKCYQLEKAEQYLTKSVANNPTVEAYQMLGDVLIKKGDKDKASESYRKGLELASSEVVKQVENISG
ncbi:MAG: heme biosynthesis protein HemY [Methylococcales symbiont of Iophon sp. n. MRB-2018]|nr:MAG: heme biosynthesis protein HemY [Methylococcales symbiont of Iophon sp. n. MRB-2018]KAF3980335.1 MAG: heme biosynthesis protein HemY [Methylococcales symbiont of Iophon sp. n. MRB-2018]